MPHRNRTAEEYSPTEYSGAESDGNAADDDVASFLRSGTAWQVGHIGAEVLAFVGIFLYFHKQTQRLQKQIDELDQKLEQFMTVLPQHVYMRTAPLHMPSSFAPVNADEIRETIRRQQMHRESQQKQPSPSRVQKEEDAEQKKEEEEEVKKEKPTKHVRFAMDPALPAAQIPNRDEPHLDEVPNKDVPSKNTDTEHPQNKYEYEPYEGEHDPSTEDLLLQKDPLL